MRQEIHLFIGNREVEFSTPPDILYNYNITDLTNPTVVKNSYSKTITIEGTPANNQIFGQLWNMERVQANGFNSGGIYFNPSKKCPFELYVDADLYESGYVKLNKVTQNRGLVEYDITLYGGLGEFFFNLDTDEDTGEKKKLYDLYYRYGGDESTRGKELDFRINKEELADLWEHIGFDGGFEAEDGGPSYRGYVLNFAPTYNGIPSSIDADKVLINRYGSNWLQVSDGNYNLGRLPEKMTTEMTKDYRSYLQRPVIRMGAVIDACCQPYNNGGYEVVRDPKFFSYRNPYYYSTWLTLPMLNDLEYTAKDNESDTLSLNPLTAGTHFNKTYRINNSSIIDNEIATVNAEVKIHIPYIGEGRQDLYLCCANFKNTRFRNTHWNAFGSIFAQMVAVDSVGNVVGASDTYNFTSRICDYALESFPRYTGSEYGTNDIYELWKNVASTTINNYPGAYQSQGDTKIIDTFGYFQKDEDGYVWTNDNGESIQNFSLAVAAPDFDHLELRLFWTNAAQSNKPGMLYSARFTVDGEVYITNVDGITAEMVGSNVVFNTDEQGRYRSNSWITEKSLLNTDCTPADYLLSYCKMFGLYISKDAYEKKIYIDTRESFYRRSNIVNLDDLIDHKKELTITVPSFEYKFYDWKQTMTDSDFAKQYKDTTPTVYGTQRVNTGYDFNADINDLYSKTCLKSAIEGFEKSKYFLGPVSTGLYAGAQPYVLCGFEYDTYSGTTTDTVTIPEKSLTTCPALQSRKYYDITPKVQFEDAEHKPLDGTNVLLFYTGDKNVSGYNYYYTDDLQAMYNLNEAPCWLLTNSEQDRDGRSVAIEASYMPVFERYLTSYSTGNITHSLDFGNPERDFLLGDYTFRPDSTIFAFFWEDYIRDMYDIDTKVLTCYAELREKPNPDWLKRFYWFNNSIWRLNRIVDWNISSFNTTKMEFVKVQDTEHYTSRDCREGRPYTLTADREWIAQSGGTVRFTLKTYDGGSAAFDDTISRLIYDEELSLRVVAGHSYTYSGGNYYLWGDTTFEITFPSNPEDYPLNWDISLRNGQDGLSHCHITQKA